MRELRSSEWRRKSSLRGRRAVSFDRKEVFKFWREKGKTF